VVARFIEFAHIAAGNDVIAGYRAVAAK